MVEYKDEKFLPVNPTIVHRLTQYMNGSKPLANVFIFRRLQINSKTNDVSAGLFIAALEKIGVYCEHLAILAPFHTIEFRNMHYGEAGNPELGSDWGKILECFPNLRKITFEDHTKEPTSLTRDTFCSLNFALANNTILQKYVETEFDVPDTLLFAFRHDYHRRQRSTDSPCSLNYVSTPLTMVGSHMMYADGAENFDLLDDDDTVFGKADDGDPLGRMSRDVF